MLGAAAVTYFTMFPKRSGSRPTATLTTPHSDVKILSLGRSTAANLTFKSQVVEQTLFSGAHNRLNSHCCRNFVVGHIRRVQIIMMKWSHQKMPIVGPCLNVFKHFIETKNRAHALESQCLKSLFHWNLLFLAIPCN